MRVAVVEEDLGPLQMGHAGVGKLDDVTIATAATTAAEGAGGAHRGLFVEHAKVDGSDVAGSASRLVWVCRDRSLLQWKKRVAGSKRVEFQL